MSTAPRTMPAKRPFNGFDVERAHYDRIKTHLLETAEGKFIAIVGTELASDPVDTLDEAVRLGYKKFGPGPLYVKRILPQDEVVITTRDIP